MSQREDGLCCKELDSALSNGSLIRVRGGKWARTMRAPNKDYPDLEQERYVEIDRCPYCNKRLNGKTP